METGRSFTALLDRRREGRIKVQWIGAEGVGVLVFTIFVNLMVSNEVLVEGLPSIVWSWFQKLSILLSKIQLSTIFSNR